MTDSTPATAATGWQPRMVWKFRLTQPVETVAMPAGATVLTVATQHGKPTIWALVDTSQPMEIRRFFAVGTGMGFLPHPSDRYIGTAHNVEGEGLVFHFFERANDADQATTTAATTTPRADAGAAPPAAVPSP